MDRTVAADDPTRSRARRLLSAIAVLVLSLGLLTGPVGAFADETDDGDDDADDAIELDVEAQAYWTNPSANSVPPTITSRFPPGTLCLVFPQPCGQDARPLTDPVDEGRETAMEGATTSPDPIQPVPPGSLPTGRLGGVVRYAAAFTFELPETPEGEEIDRFELILEERQPTYAMDSPAFRQTVLAALVGVDYGRDDQEAAVENFIEQMQRISDDPDSYPPLDDAPLELEACALLDGIEEGDNQHWDERPEVDCFVGATGVRDEDGTWRFDLSFAAQDWDAGELPVVGVYLGPHAAENLAFGDPDTSDNAQVTLHGAGLDEETGTPPRALIEYREAFGDLAFDLEDAPSEPAPEPATEPAQTGTVSGEVFGESPAMTADVGAATDDESVAEVAEPVAQAEDPVAVRAVEGTTSTPATTWAALPLALAVLFGLARMLAVEPSLGAGRAGAMTRLIEARAAEVDA